MSRLLTDRDASECVPDSRFNRLIGRLLVGSGLPRPEYEWEVVHNGRLVGRVDLAYPRSRLAIECDSERWHRNRQSFIADPRRKNRILMAGFRVLTFTWDDDVARPDRIVDTVRSALADVWTFSPTRCG